MFDIAIYLESQRQRIDNALNEALPAKETPPGILHEAMRYSVLSGGKRLRPILTLAAAEALGADTNNIINTAIAVELLHTYTLIHDDLPCMDDDDERRGKPTSHKKFGEANAILAGDALQALAFELAALSPVAPDLVVRELTRAAGSRGVVGGQVADIMAGNNMTPDELAFIHQHKTADLFRAAVRMGAIAARASAIQLEKLTLYADNIGLAFQIIDDILDADEEEACSCVNLYGIDEAKRQAAERTQAATAALKDFGDTATPLQAIAQHMLERTT